MGFRYRRSIKLFPGVKINFGKKTHSWTIGGKAARTTYNPTTKKVTQSYSTPVKGLYWQKQYSTKSQDSPKTARKVNDYDYTDHNAEPFVGESGTPKHGFLHSVSLFFESLGLIVKIGWLLIQLAFYGLIVYFFIRIIIALF
ncbi:DUF4236 domain-containing protein [Sporolactobacillus sp. CQH2019]|uniref:DUF4236 domain-containing protein n=1 Tax=Sporolactobacillus sp. CQH2019 TaxID=3023512 RepID=UPI00236741FB|nr:DUF4236 domain-containing protein [Sporolactobacillus sp. CQH2019]MDD9149348.1 DUF4236 domain-containing protein [Sporolactobacillus sp. CQH2019]